MSDRTTHKLAGVGSGTVFAACRAKGQSFENFLAEVAGGAIGGYFGGILPDVLEPAISSWHRSVAHSYVSAGTIFVSAGAVLSTWETACRTKAENWKALQMIPGPNGTFVVAPSDPIQRLLLSVAELFWRLAAGFLNGFTAGYISHLALDAVTPRSIPLLASGF
jgi:hypothetical protein